MLRIEPPTSVQARPGNQSHFAAFVRQGIAELDHAQVIVHVVLRDRDVVIHAFLDHFARNLAADVADFALQIAHARLAGVGANQAGYGFVREFDVLIGEPGLRHLLLHQELLGDLNFFLLGVAMQPQHFHAVLQRGRNGVDHVGSRDEEIPAKGRTRRRGNDPRT